MCCIHVGVKYTKRQMWLRPLGDSKDEKWRRCHSLFPCHSCFDCWQKCDRKYSSTDIVSVNIIDLYRVANCHTHRCSTESKCQDRTNMEMKIKKRPFSSIFPKKCPLQQTQPVIPQRLFGVFNKNYKWWHFP